MCGTAILGFLNSPFWIHRDVMLMDNALRILFAKQCQAYLLLSFKSQTYFQEPTAFLNLPVHICSFV